MSGYNGYTNYETWCVCLWIGNDQADYMFWREQARGVTPGELARTLEAHFEECAPAAAGVYADLLTHALGRVDWYEVADAIMEGLE